MNQPTTYDVIITGGSYAGLSAAMSLGRAMRKVLVIDSGEPCNKQAPHSHNFITQDGETPANIIRKIKEQLNAYPTLFFLNVLVTEVQKTGESFDVITASGEVFHTTKLLFATGVKNKMPDIPGFADCWGISILHCPYCHGYEVRNQPTGIFANADLGFEMARLISNWTKDLTLFTNGRAVFSAEQKEKLADHGIRLVEKEIGSVVHEQGAVKYLEFTDKSRHEISVLYAKLGFEQHCTLPELLGCELTDDGFIKVDDFKRTSIPGIYAAGDNITPLRSISNANAGGNTAGAFINHELIVADF